MGHPLAGNQAVPSVGRVPITALVNELRNPNRGHGGRTQRLKAARLQLRLLDGGLYRSMRGITNPATPQEKDPVMVGWQKAAGLMLAAALLMSFFKAPLATAIIVNAIFTLFFVAANLFKLALVRRSFTAAGGISVSQEELANMRSKPAPTFTILVPLYGEGAMVAQLLEGIDHLDYPAAKLDVKFLVEADDEDTLAALKDIDRPYLEVLVVPDVGPRGKPRACNHGLATARGDYLVIYDAEDRPEADQLRKVVAAFANVDDDVVCLQAHLNYFNRTHNVLTRWFSAEYSMWFDQLLTGMQSHELAIPLGGTSNHFVTDRLRDLGGWNAYNVTEDADLGMRIFRRGWKTAIVESTTYEEATSQIPNWIRQRSRWIKGYMQTYLSHTRDPIRLYREMGPRAFAGFHLFFGAQTFCLLINPLYWLITALWFATHAHIIELTFPWLVADIGLAGFVLGNAAFVICTLLGCLGRRNYEDVKWILLVPFYWLLMSVAAWKALWQLVVRPYYWEKTVHGFVMFKDSQSYATRPSNDATDAVAVAS